MPRRHLFLMLALCCSASAQTTNTQAAATQHTATLALQGFLPSGGAVPLSISLDLPLVQDTLPLALRGDFTFVPGVGAPPAVSALLIAEAKNSSRLTPYLGAGVGTVPFLNGGTWSVQPTWAALIGLQGHIASPLGLRVELRATRAAIGVSAGVSIDLPLGAMR